MVVLFTTLQLCILVSRALGGYGVFGEDKNHKYVLHEIFNDYFLFKHTCTYQSNTR